MQPRGGIPGRAVHGTSPDLTAASSLDDEFLGTPDFETQLPISSDVLDSLKHREPLCNEGELLVAHLQVLELDPQTRTRAIRSKAIPCVPSGILQPAEVPTRSTRDRSAA